MLEIEPPPLILTLAICVGLRVLDLYLTWLITPDLRYELNPLIRRLGWRKTIWLNVLALLLAGICFQFAICLGALSLLACLWNCFILRHFKRKSRR